MPIKYDAVMGDIREQDVSTPTSPEETMSGTLLLHLPLRADTKDYSERLALPLSGDFQIENGWGIPQSEVVYPLDGLDFPGITLTANVKVTENSYSGMFGIDSYRNAFFWEHRRDTTTVLETWDSSYDFEFDQSESGETFHLSAVWDGNKISVYVNGMLQDSERWDIELVDPFFYIWGGWGKISDIRLFNKVLTEAEIADVYNYDRRTD